MGELLPVIGGVIVGVAVARLVAAGRRWPWLLAASVVVGVLAAAVNGELAVSVGFLLFDVPLAGLSAVVAARLADLAATRRWAA